MALVTFHCFGFGVEISIDRKTPNDLFLLGCWKFLCPQLRGKGTRSCEINLRLAKNGYRISTLSLLEPVIRSELR